MSPPSHYKEEAEDLLRLLGQAESLLELGSGGGSLAFNLKHRFTLTLTDISPQMLAVNRRTNPECEHLLGDMTSLNLGRKFDRVLIHDAIMYATTSDDVRATLQTAARHCRPGGLVIVLPDCVRETFVPDTQSGGEDGDDGRALRYLQWRWDPDPSDCTYEVAVAFLLKQRGVVRMVEDHHLFGLFSRAEWLEQFEAAGLSPRIHHDSWNRDVFIGAA
jgi:SAM-dependent methyltransferase